MTITLLTKPDLSILNKQDLKYRLADAEKIRAASGRARYRDFYDLALLFESFKFDINEIASLIKQKEIRKPIKQRSVFNNWKAAKKEKEEELSRIYYAKSISDADIEGLIQKLKINVE